MTHEDVKKMFISSVERVFSSLEEGERFGSKEEFAKRLWADSNVQYAFITYRAQVLEEVKQFHEKEDCIANNEGQWCCVEKFLKHPTN
jgi:hypothetical protein